MGLKRAIKTYFKPLRKGLKYVKKNPELLQAAGAAAAPFTGGASLAIAGAASSVLAAKQAAKDAKAGVFSTAPEDLMSGFVGPEQAGEGVVPAPEAGLFARPIPIGVLVAAGALLVALFLVKRR